MSDFVRQALVRWSPIVAAFIWLGVVAAQLVDYTHAEKFANDFSVYWRVANRAPDLAYMQSGRYPFPYFPTMLLWISPLSLSPRWPAYFAFVAISAAAFVLVCRPYLSKPQIALAMASPPFVRAFSTGQVSIALTALLLWCCGTSGIAAGIGLGVIASIKPQLVVMAPLMLALNRDWRALVAAGGTFLLTALASIAIFGVERWPEWLALMDYFHRAVSDTNIIDGVVSFAGIAEKFGLAALPALLLGLTVGGALTYACRNAEPLGKAGAIVTGSLIASPYGWAYDLIGVVPFLVLAIYQGRIWALLAVASLPQPIPIAIAVFELWAGRKSPDVGNRSAAIPS